MITSRYLLDNEIWDRTIRFFPKPTSYPASAQSVAQALLENPGRFSSPLSWAEKLKLKFFIESSQFDFFHLERYFFASPERFFIPYPWQVLLRYLIREGVISEEGVRVHALSHDRPPFIQLGVKENLIETRSMNTRITGTGHTADFHTALSKAIGEMLERFFLSTPTDTIMGSVETLRSQGKRYLLPTSLSQFSSEQKARYSRFSLEEKSPFAWVEGENLLSRQKVLLPIQCVFWRRQLEQKEKVIRQPTSNGCAGHFTKKEAILSGIYENVERDGFLIYWLNNIPPKVIDIESIQDEELQEFVQKLKRYQFEVRFLNITTDIGIPSVICVLIDRSSEGPRIALGGGCGWKVKRALKSALYEALSVDGGKFTEELALSKNYTPFLQHRINRLGRLSLWRNPEMFPKIEPFLSGPQETLEEAFPHLPQFSTLEEEYQHTTDIFRRLGEGYQIYIYEKKHPVLETIGYHVLKVLIPEMVHLYLNEDFAPLGASRLRSVPKKLGYPETKEWNPWPHPFP